MVSEEQRILISPCGLYCGGCALYRAHTDASLKQKIAERQGIPVDKVATCAGCRSLKGLITATGFNTVCATYACVMQKGVEYCYQCDEFPCLKLAPCADRAKEIPHNTKIYNLLLMQKLGLDAWLKKYDELSRQYRQGKKVRGGGEIEM